MKGRTFGPSEALLFDDGSAQPTDAALFYPESIRGIAPHLSELISERIRKPGWFNATAPMIVEQIIDFFDVIHAMHERAQALLADYSGKQQPYCLYLRSFSAAGYRGEVRQDPSSTQQLMLGTGDQDFRDYVSDRLRGLLPVISCFNTLDLFTVASVRQSKEERPAILRLLSHTWKPAIAALIDNARMIVLHLSPTMHGNATAGVEAEMRFLHRFEQTQRCLLVLSTDRRVPRHGRFDFRAAFGWPAAKAEQEFSDALTILAADAFHRQSLRSKFPDLPCYVIDRQIEPALEQFRNDDISAVNYTNFIPRSLQPNMEMINAEYPNWIERWAAIEGRLQAPGQVGTEEVEQAMFVALLCFVLATTLELYEPMARCIAMVGLAHRLLTQDAMLERICLSGAATFARLGGMEDLAAYFAKAQAETG